MLTTIRRLLSAAIALVLGVSFIATSLILATSMDATLRSAAGGAIRDASVVLTRSPEGGDPAFTEEYVAAVAALPGVDHVRPRVVTIALNQQAGGIQMFVLQNSPELSDATRLLAGRLPRAADEVAVNEVAARNRGWSPGDTVTLDVDNVTDFTLVGVIDAASDTTTEPARPHAFLSMPGITRLSGRTTYTDVYVHGPGPAPELVDAIEALPGTADTQAAVLTAAEASDQRLTEFTRGSEQLTVLLLAFGAVALVVAGLVVANTFAILVSQRTRQLALLRAVGATRRQVFATVIGEAAVLGLAAGLVGVAAGAGIVGLIAPASRGTAFLRIEQVVIAPRDVILPFAVGVVLAVVSALVPARRATRVHPLAALRPQVATAVDPSGRRRWPVVWVVATLAGFVLLALGGVVLPRADVEAGVTVLVGIAGGLLSVFGVLALGPHIIPTVARWLSGPLRRLGGVPSELAADNAIRNPSRAAATAGALLVGVSLVSMMTVGAATGQASILRNLDQHYPMDAQATSMDSFTDAQVALARTLPDLAGVTELFSHSTTTADGRGVTLMGLGPDAADAIRHPTLMDALADGVLLKGPRRGFTDGEQVRVALGADDVTLTVRIDPGVGDLSAVTLDTLRPALGESTRSLGMRFADGVDPVAATGRVATALGEVGPPVQILSVAEQRAQTQQVTDTVLLIVLGLLAVAVVIAVVGIGNTLGLSVHERRQESGLLRALGLTRSQLRASLGWEAVLLAAVASVLGVALGVVYGLAGVSALIAADAEVVVTIPWLRLALIAAVALLAGWLASVLPAVRASKVPPAAALALGE
ncbi:MAG: FtsX-like permease family protein [Propionibacteriaceae bacterium]|nr:FtsX-like permease family protein [Propionibacteriaceae bacterium]